MHPGNPCTIDLPRVSAYSPFRVTRMICRTLRGRASAWASAAMALCVALSGLSMMEAFAPPMPLGDEAPTITLRGPSIPWADVTEGAGHRLEKQAQTSRPSLLKPARNTQRAAATVRPARPQQVRPLQLFREFPRCFLPPQHSGMVSSEDSGDPYLS